VEKIDINQTVDSQMKTAKNRKAMLQKNWEKVKSKL